MSHDRSSARVAAELGSDFFDELAPSFGASYASNKAFQQRLGLFLDTARVTRVPSDESRPVCLDLGCGPGVMALSIAALGYDVMGVDSSSRMIDEARAAAARAGVGDDRCNFQHQDLGLFLGSLDRSVDLVVCSSVLEYLPDPRAIVEAAASRLKPGGTLAVSIPNRHSLLRRFESLLHALARRRSPAMSHWQNRLDARELVGTARQAGLRLVRVRHFGFPRLGGTLLRPISGNRVVGTLSLLVLTKRAGSEAV